MERRFDALLLNLLQGPSLPRGGDAEIQMPARATVIRKAASQVTT